MTTHDELVEAIRKTFGFGSPERTHLEEKLEQARDQAVLDLRKRLRALPDETHVGKEAASVFLGVSERQLRVLAAENDAYKASVVRGKGQAKQYTIGQLKVMAELLDQREDRLRGRDGKRIVEVSTDDFNPTVLAQLTAKHRIGRILIEVFPLDGDVQAFMLVGLRDALLDHLWDEPGQLLAAQGAYQEALQTVVMNRFLEAHAKTEQVRLREVLGG